MGSSQGFASTAADIFRPIQTRFPCGFDPEGLNRASDGNSSDHYAKGTLSHMKCAPTECRRMVSGSVSSPSRGSSHLSLALLYAIGCQVVFSLRRWSSQIQSRFHVTGRTRVSYGSLTIVAYGAVTRYGATFHWLLLTVRFVTSQCKTPRPQRNTVGLGYFPLRSPLLRESIFLSFPAGTKMFQFSAFARESQDQSSFDSSPGHFAAFHALMPPDTKTSPIRP